MRSEVKLQRRAPGAKHQANPKQQTDSGRHKLSSMPLLPRLFITRNTETTDETEQGKSLPHRKILPINIRFYLNFSVGFVDSVAKKSLLCHVCYLAWRLACSLPFTLHRLIYSRQRAKMLEKFFTSSGPFTNGMAVLSSKSGLKEACNSPFGLTSAMEAE